MLLAVATVLVLHDVPPRDGVLLRMTVFCDDAVVLHAAALRDGGGVATAVLHAANEVLLRQTTALLLGGVAHATLMLH